VGSFDGIEKCKDSYECTDTFSAYVSSAGNVQLGSENIDWINGNATVATNYTLNFNTSKLILTAGMNCAVTADNVGRSARILSPSSTSVVVTVFNTLAQVATTDTGFWIICQKSGADYIGKTAKAVASDQNLRTPGVTNGVVYSARVSFTGSIITQKGSWLTSVTNNATGDLSLNIPSGKFSTVPICSCTPEITTGDSSFYLCNQNIDTLAPTHIRFRAKNIANAAFNIQAQIVCHGEL
jgi:hypothetical protein